MTDAGKATTRFEVVVGLEVEATPAGYAVTGLRFNLSEVTDENFAVLRAFPQLRRLELVETMGITPRGLAHLEAVPAGEHHTQALVRAIPQLSGDARDRARQALAERLARLSTSALHDMLHDASAEVRRAAAKACAIQGATSLVPDLRRLVEDADAEVAKVARAAIAELAPSGP
jgi:hypothetical protein